jgi:hypothetical protein
VRVTAHADWIIDLGPGAGHGGGRVVFEGTPPDLVAARSTITGQHLAEYMGLTWSPSSGPVSASGEIVLAISPLWSGPLPCPLRCGSPSPGSTSDGRVENHVTGGNGMLARMRQDSVHVFWIGFLLPIRLVLVGPGSP